MIFPMVDFELVGLKAGDQIIMLDPATGQLIYEAAVERMNCKTFPINPNIYPELEVRVVNTESDEFYHAKMDFTDGSSSYKLHVQRPQASELFDRRWVDFSVDSRCNTRYTT